MISRRDKEVEVLGRYSNHADQGERLSKILDSIPTTPPKPETQTSKQVHRRLKPKEIADLRNAYLAGATTYQLADALDIHRHTVAIQLKANHVDMRRRSLDPEEVALASALYESGLSLVEVADSIGRKRSGVANALKRSGVILRPRRGWRY